MVGVQAGAKRRLVVVTAADQRLACNLRERKQVRTHSWSRDEVSQTVKVASLSLLDVFYLNCSLCFQLVAHLKGMRSPDMLGSLLIR